MNVSPVHNEADKPWLRSKCSFTLPSSLLGVVRGSSPDKTGTNGSFYYGLTDSTRLFALESRLEAAIKAQTCANLTAKTWRLMAVTGSS